MLIRNGQRISIIRSRGNDSFSAFLMNFNFPTSENLFRFSRVLNTRDLKQIDVLDYLEFLWMEERWRSVVFVFFNWKHYCWWGWSLNRVENAGNVCERFISSWQKGSDLSSICFTIVLCSGRFCFMGKRCFYQMYCTIFDINFVIRCQRSHKLLYSFRWTKRKWSRWIIAGEITC